LNFIRVFGERGSSEIYLVESKQFGKVAIKKTPLGGDEKLMNEA